MTLTALIGQWVINSTLSDLGGGDAFGARRFIGTLPFIAFAIAAFVEKCWYSRVILIITVVCFITINLLLISFFHYDLIPRHGTFNLFSLPL